MPGRKRKWTAKVYSLAIVRNPCGRTDIMVQAKHQCKTDLCISFLRDGKVLCEGLIKGTGRWETLRMSC